MNVFMIGVNIEMFVVDWIISVCVVMGGLNCLISFGLVVNLGFVCI